MVDVRDVTYMDDQAKYTCKMEVGELVEECSLMVSVGCEYIIFFLWECIVITW